ncbi:MAG: hypothetical protein GEU97_01955 [Actinophytocola sp.]|nr:hypothetical protein [Actinophytocola sp.]
MPINERQPRRSTVTTLACVCGLAVTSLAAGAQPNGAATVPLALPDVIAHPPILQDFPLPTVGDEPRADDTTASIGARLNQLVPHVASDAQATLAFALDDGTIPQQVLAAYRRAADILSRRDSSCRLHWSVLAGIGRIESGHTRGGALFSDGRTASPILGPRLDGSLAGTATIRDSTGGQFDGDVVWERAVGPMQFLPSTWLQYAQDGNGDGARDPHNVYDAALGSAVYLCAGGRDLSEPSQLNQALFSYNPSMEYVRAVLAWADHYAGLGPRPGAARTVMHTLAMPRGADGTGGEPERRKPKPDDEPATRQEPPKPVTPTTPPKSPGQGSGGDNEERAGNDTSKPDTHQDRESTEDTEEPPAAPNDDESGHGGGGTDAPDSPDTTEPPEPEEPSAPEEPTEPTDPAEPTEPTEPADPGDTDDPACEPPDDTDGTNDGEDADAEDRTGDADRTDDGNNGGGDGDDKADETDDNADDADDAKPDGDDQSSDTCEQPDGGDGNGTDGRETGATAPTSTKREND